LADQIIGGLNYLQNINVRASSSVREYENKKVNPQQIGKELDVNYVLTGNYLVENKNIRLNVELVMTKSNNLIWRGKRIEVNYENAFKLQDMVSEKIIDRLKIQFAQDERNRMQIDTPKNSTAYDYYQLSLVQPATTNGNKEAIALLEKSVEYDSTYAPAYNQIGFRIHSLTSYNLKGIRSLEEAEIALNKALRFNPELLSALGNLARIYTETGRLLEAQKLVLRMLEINQNNSFAHFVQGYIYRYAGLLNEAKEEMEKAVSIDPTDKVYRSLGLTYYYLGEYKKALEAFDIDKGSWYALTYQGLTRIHMGKNTIAREYFSSVIDMDPESFSANLSIALMAYIDGKTMDGLNALHAIEQDNPADADIWYLIAGAYALLKNKDGTLRTLGRAVEVGSYLYPYLEKYSYFDFVRNEPQFQKILVIAKEKHESYRKILLSK